MTFQCWKLINGHLTKESVIYNAMQWLDPDPGPHPLATDDGRVTLAWSHSGHQLMVQHTHTL